MAEVAGPDEAGELERLVQAGLEIRQASAFLGICEESRPVFDLLLGYDEGRGEFAGQGTPQADFDAVVQRLRAYLREKGVDAELLGVPVQEGPEPTGVAEGGPAWPQLRAWFPPSRGTLDAMVESLRAQEGAHGRDAGLFGGLEGQRGHPHDIAEQVESAASYQEPPPDAAAKG